MTRRQTIVWSARLLVGVGLGFAVRMYWERKPAVRFATGLTLHSLRGPSDETGPRRSHLQDGVPVRFSLDEIMEAADSAAALRAWREAFASASQGDRDHCLATPIEASVTALRRCLTHLARQPALREEFSLLMTLLTENSGISAGSEVARRAFVELARLDHTLALDGADASGDEDIKQAVWSVIAEDDPQRVLDLIATGRAPRAVLSLAMASLAARSPEEADAALAKLEEPDQARSLEPIAEAMAAIDPIKALSMVAGENGKPDVGWVENLAANVPATKAVDFLVEIETSHPELLGVCSDALNRLAGEQAHRDPEFVLGWFDRFVARTPGMPTWAHDLFAHVAAASPRETSETLAFWSQHGSSRDVLASLARVWMETRPLEALEWIHQQSDSKKLLSQAIGSGRMGLEDGAAVAEWLQQRGRLNDLGAAADELASRWAATDPHAAIAWARTLPDANHRHAAMTATWSQWMRSDPAAAETHISTQVADDTSLLPAALWALKDGGSRGAFAKLMTHNVAALASAWESSPHLQLTISESIVYATWSPATRDTALNVLVKLPNSEMQQRLLTRITSSSPTDLSFIRRATSMMPDQARATELMEESVRRAFR